MTVSSVCVTRESDIQWSVTAPVAAVACCQKTMFGVRLIVSPCQCVQGARSIMCCVFQHICSASKRKPIVCFNSIRAPARHAPCEWVTPQCTGAAPSAELRESRQCEALSDRREEQTESEQRQGSGSRR
jgi:hypothetical protein